MHKMYESINITYFNAILTIKPKTQTICAIELIQ